jgi:hypothetical protein
MKNKNCIVLSGQYRTFDQTKENIRKFIEINNMDVYCHLWSMDTEEIDNIKHTLQPKAILCEDWKNYKEEFDDIEKRVRSSNPKNAPNDKIAGNASMNFSRKRAFELVDKEYESLVYCRYDITFKYPFGFEFADRVYTPIEESYNLISDIFAIMPFQMAKNYFIYDNYEKLHSTQFEPVFEDYLRFKKNYGEENIRIHKYERYCPHMMLLRNLVMTNTPFSVVDLPVSLQR